MTPEDCEDTKAHRKRLSDTLRYIARMHESAAGEGQFVLDDPREKYADFFQSEDDSGVLFSTADFCSLLALEREELAPFLLNPAPFQFYAAASQQPHRRKRTLAGAIKETIRSVTDPSSNRACWLRITRLTVSQLVQPDELLKERKGVQEYLNEWLSTTPDVKSVDQLLTIRRIVSAPKAPPSASGEVNRFLRKTKKYLVRKTYQQTLEPIYNRLFEWIQQQHDHQAELVWGLGHAHLRCEEDGGSRVVNGPLLEILMEVELARDGSLLVRPRDHTGVTLNRLVVSALTSTNTSQALLSTLHKTVAGLEPADLSPGQPATYIPLLKRMSMELSAGGRFQASSTKRKAADGEKLIVTEAWCLFSRPKPSSVWARDAMAFADQLDKATAVGRISVDVPLATWSITHGPDVLEAKCGLSNDKDDDLTKRFRFWWHKKQQQKERPPRPHFPLPTSDAQNQIADLLLNKGYPAVVCEGPPGTGKTHTIANIICAYLCKGKRVLVTSKNSPALSVIRDRLPSSTRDLCVDISLSESSGMRQLQKTVERLANRICSVSSIVEKEKSGYLERNIADLEVELQAIDKKLSQRIEGASSLIRCPQGAELVEHMAFLTEKAPWITKQWCAWTKKDVKRIKSRIDRLLIDEQDKIYQVSGFSLPVTDSIIQFVGSKIGKAMAAVKSKTTLAVASIPFIGRVSGLQGRVEDTEKQVTLLLLNGSTPTSTHQWQIVFSALVHSKAVSEFEKEIWNPNEQSNGWPMLDFHNDDGKTIREISSIFTRAYEGKKLAGEIDVDEAISTYIDAQALDTRRGVIESRVQTLAGELVDCKVVMELNRSFSADAQSALIRFSQIAGKTKFNKSSQPSKMSQRQRRRRQEYLNAFDECCRFIPCWILTTSQICDYLPSECGLFDLIICDEASQSEVVSILPGMMRGKQWLIVGDTKQVSPTENFIPEDQIESLRASLPVNAFANSLLPGQSFFDLCAQAFPRGRVVLNEHFRCAEEIIAFSNEQFYDDNLVPLRLPTKMERISPPLVDVKVSNGSKQGKINELEADEVVKRIQKIVTNSDEVATKRSIGVISLIGDEQSRLIRGRLLDTIGPQKMSEHNILVGDPPTFQGAERDLIFLSMVASPGSIPTQSQLMHYQRVNVALSRARDQCTLVRSIELTDIPSADDIKVPVLEFFQNYKPYAGEPADALVSSGIAQRLLRNVLERRRFSVRHMGVVWKNALCVEHEGMSNSRAAMLVEGVGESLQEWRRAFAQQKAIERVGWKCIRVDAMALFVDFDRTLSTVLRFLSSAGLEEPPIVYDSLDSADEGDDQASSAQIGESAPSDRVLEEVESVSVSIGENDNEHEDLENTVVISSDEEDTKPLAKISRSNRGKPEDFAQDVMEASNFGVVVDLGFLKRDTDDEEEEAGTKSPLFSQTSRRASKRSRRQGRRSGGSFETSDSSTSVPPSIKKRQKVSKRRRRGGSDQSSSDTKHEKQDRPPKASKSRRYKSGHSRAKGGKHRHLDSDNQSESSSDDSVETERELRSQSLKQERSDAEYEPQHSTDESPEDSSTDRSKSSRRQRHQGATAETKEDMVVEQDKQSDDDDEDHSSPDDDSTRGKKTRASQSARRKRREGTEVETAKDIVVNPGELSDADGGSCSADDSPIKKRKRRASTSKRKRHQRAKIGRQDDMAVEQEGQSDADNDLKPSAGEIQEKIAEDSKPSGRRRTHVKVETKEDVVVEQDEQSSVEYGSSEGKNSRTPMSTRRQTRQAAKVETAEAMTDEHEKQSDDDQEIEQRVESSNDDTPQKNERKARYSAGGQRQQVKSEANETIVIESDEDDDE